MAYLLMVGGVLVSLFEGIFIKKYNSRHSKGGFIFSGLVSLCSMLFFVISDSNGLNFSYQIIPYALAAGVMYCTASFLTYLAIGCGSFAISMLILSYSIIFPIGYGLLFLNEPAGIYTYIGLLMLVVSLYLFRGEKDNEKSFSLKWVVCILISVIGSGMFSVISRIQQIRFDDLYTNEFMVIALGFSAFLLLVTGIIKDRKNLIYIIKNGSLYALGAGLSNGMTNFCILVVNTLIPISVASPTQSGIKVVLSFLTSIILFKEKFLKRQIVGVLLGFFAVIFLNI